MIVVSDTSPLNYLVLIGQVEVLPKLFGRVVIPSAVSTEMQRTRTPDAVRGWIANPPVWLDILTPLKLDDTIQSGTGEVEAISLALELRSELLLMDDRAARRAA